MEEHEVRITSSKPLPGFAKFRRSRSGFGPHGFSVYVYVVPDDLVDRAVRLGGSIEEAPGEN